MRGRSIAACARPLAACLTTSLACLAAAAPAVAFDSSRESLNFSKIHERLQYITLTPGFQALMAQQNARDSAEVAQIVAHDPERNFTGNICWQHKNECAGDLRFYDWNGPYGIVKPVLFTARDGATISGNVWATRAGPARRPGIVITTGSVQAPETLYWGLAATLARHGYIVLTYDVQGQGRSDTYGVGADQQEGVPSQAGQPFYDGSEDALDFLLSTPAHPYVPRDSCGNANGGKGTSHADKQRRRVKEGFDAAYDPLYGVLDPKRIGIAGHSLGAAGVSYIGQRDPRVKALVAWDNLAASRTGGVTTVDAGGETCPSAPATRKPVRVTKPALGMSADYSLVPTAYTADPDPNGKSTAYLAYKAAGIDAMQVIVRGGTHYEFSFIPGNTAPFPLGTATYRGMDMVAWYTTAWFDRFVKGDRHANARLLTNRWCDDAREKAVDPNSPRDGDLYSFYYRSQLAFGIGKGRSATSTDMRADCSRAGVLRSDGLPATYDFVADAHTPDHLDRPDTRIIKAKITQEPGSATFRFKGLGTVDGFQCRLHRVGAPAYAFGPCGSPRRYRRVKDGKYVFEVRAWNLAGADPTPARRRFSVQSPCRATGTHHDCDPPA
ncbi:MAG: hypothetical protein JOZ25_00365 [Actinobacteria bacterium]|nr:hypothetical protein [Actinomycetota bacterium]